MSRVINAADFGLQEQEPTPQKSTPFKAIKEPYVLLKEVLWPPWPQDSTPRHPFLNFLQKQPVCGRQVNVNIPPSYPATFSQNPQLNIRDNNDAITFVVRPISKNCEILRVTGHALRAVVERHAIAERIDNGIEDMKTHLEESLFNGNEAGIAGLEQWLPDVVDSTPFFGVDRTIDSTRLAGHRLYEDSLEEGINNASIRIGEEGGRPDIAFMGFETYRKLMNEIAGEAEGVMDVADKGDHITIYGPTGLVKCISSRHCTDDSIFLLSMDSWRLCHLGVSPRDMINLDMNRSATGDDCEVRIYSYCQLSCHRPEHNARITLEE